MMNTKRKFDWDEARRLRGEGLTKKEIARRLGVTPRAVGCAINGSAQGIRECPGCGRWIDCSADICSACRAPSLVNRDEQGRFYCPRCKRWKLAAEFRPSKKRPARGVAGRCRSCETADRRARRHANPDATRAYDRERYRKKRR